MADNPQAMAELRRLLAAREPLYAEAAHTVDTSRLDADGVAREVERLVCRRSRFSRFPGSSPFSPSCPARPCTSPEPRHAAGCLSLNRRARGIRSLEDARGVAPSRDGRRGRGRSVFAVLFALWTALRNRGGAHDGGLSLRDGD